jgi:hypothetical protein
MISVISGILAVLFLVAGITFTIIGIVKDCTR